MCEQDPRLIYPEVPDHFAAVRQHSAHCEEAPVSGRSYQVNTEATILTSESVARTHDEDLFALKLAEEDGHLKTWARRLLRCGCCLKTVALVSMVMAGYHLINPPNFDEMLLLHGPMGEGHPGSHKWGPQNWDNEQENTWQHHGRHLRKDKDFFAVFNPPTPNVFPP